MDDQFTVSPELPREFKTKRPTFSNKFTITSVQVKTIKNKKIMEIDIKLLLTQTCTNISTLIEQSNFTFNISFFAILDIEICNLEDVKETCSQYSDEVFVHLTIKK